MASLKIHDYKEKPVYPKQRRIILLRNYNLAFRPVSVADTGEYVCFNKGIHEAFYRLDVLHKSERRLVMESGPPDMRPLESVALEKENLMIFTNWGEWSGCSKCGTRGFRERAGFCWVNKFHPKKKAADEEIEAVFDMLKGGFPCYSSIAPKHVREIEQIKDRASESMMGWCKKRCPHIPKVRMFKNELGQIEEIVRPGYFSMKEKMPTLPPIAKRFFVYADEDKNKVVICPNKKAHNRKNKIQWMKKHIELNPLQLLRETKGRVRLDLQNRIRIKKFKASDIASYSCWFQGRMLAVVRVSMTSGRIERKYFDYLTTIGFSMAVFFIFKMVWTFYRRSESIKNMS